MLQKVSSYSSNCRTSSKSSDTGVSIDSNTVSMAKSLGFRGKQLHKRQPSETQSHTWYLTKKQTNKTWSVSHAAETRNKYLPDHQWPMSTYHCMEIQLCLLLMEQSTWTKCGMNILSKCQLPSYDASWSKKGWLTWKKWDWHLWHN